METSCKEKILTLRACHNASLVLCYEHIIFVIFSDTKELNPFYLGWIRTQMNWKNIFGA